LTTFDKRSITAQAKSNVTFGLGKQIK